MFPSFEKCTEIKYCDKTPLKSSFTEALEALMSHLPNFMVEAIVHNLANPFVGPGRYEPKMVAHICFMLKIYLELQLECY